MQSADGLLLRDLHAATAPSWWPLAPGWWAVLAALLIVATGVIVWRVRRQRHRRALLALFDDALAQADTPAAQMAAISDLLRRAARRHDPQADRLQGAQWLQCLDSGQRVPVFATEQGERLLDGAFRRDVTEAEVEALRAPARRRFLTWMGTRP